MSIKVDVNLALHFVPSLITIVQRPAGRGIWSLLEESYGCDDSLIGLDAG